MFNTSDTGNKGSVIGHSGVLLERSAANGMHHTFQLGVTLAGIDVDSAQLVVVVVVVVSLCESSARRL